MLVWLPLCNKTDELLAPPGDMTTFSRAGQEKHVFLHISSEEQDLHRSPRRHPLPQLTGKNCITGPFLTHGRDAVGAER